MLESTLDALRELKYDVRAFDATSWASDAEMLNDLSVGLRFPDYFGHNLDALHDCLTDLADDRAGWDAPAEGMVLVFRRFDQYAARGTRGVVSLLQSIANASWRGLLVGNRVICLLQTDSPHWVPTVHIDWNVHEWHPGSRQVPPPHGFASSEPPRRETNSTSSSGDLVMPIIAFSNGGIDVDVFPDARTAIGSVEAIDVQDGEYEFYDAHGHPLHADTHDWTVTAFRRDTSRPRDEESVTARLRQRIDRIGAERVGLPEFETAPLHALAEALMHHEAQFRAEHALTPRALLRRIRKRTQ